MPEHRFHHADLLRSTLTSARDKALEILESDDRAAKNAGQLNAAQRAEAQHMGLLRLIEEYDIAAQQVFLSVMETLRLDTSDMVAFLNIPIRKRVNLGDISEEEWRPYASLVELGLAENISSHFPGGSRGIMLTPAGQAIAMLLPSITPRTE